MRILVLGGTSFLSKEVAVVGVRRGHDVVCAARGRTGPAPAGAELVVVDRDEPGAIEVLAGQRFDAVVDVATMALKWVREALAAIGAQAGHWTYVSSINAYADTATRHQTATDGRLHDPITDLERSELSEVTPEIYGGVEVACENAVRDALGDKAFILRPGQISGPGDYIGRLGYWLARFTRGGRVVVPDDAEQPFQHIDARDLAEWIVTAGEQRIAGSFDGTGPVRGFAETLQEIADLIAPEGTELVPVRPEVLTAAGVQPWFGPKSLPLWLPPSHYGLLSHDATASRDAGLTSRSLADTVQGNLAYERERGLDRPRDGGLTPEEETALLQDL